MPESNLDGLLDGHADLSRFGLPCPVPGVNEVNRVRMTRIEGAKSVANPNLGILRPLLSVALIPRDMVALRKGGPGPIDADAISRGKNIRARLNVGGGGGLVIRGGVGPLRVAPISILQFTRPH
jgi:hypothetical protein